MVFKTFPTDTIYVLLSGDSPGAAWDESLSADGAAAAKALAGQLGALDLDGLMTSPLDQALETAAFIADAQGLPSVTLPDLREHRIALNRPSHWAELTDRAFDKGGVAMPGGETLAGAAARFSQALLMISRRPVRSPLAVTHPVIFATLLRRKSKEFGPTDWRGLKPLSLYKITHNKGSPKSVEPVSLTG